MNTKRCSGYKRYWACVKAYPDHLMPYENFAKTSKDSYTCKHCDRHRKKMERSGKGGRWAIMPRHPIDGSLKHNWIASKAVQLGGNRQDRRAEEWKSKYKEATESWNREIQQRSSDSFPFRDHRKLPKVRRPKGKRITVFKPNDPRGFVYIFKDHMKSVNGWLYYYKVGASHDPQERLNQANTWGDFESVWESDMVDDCASLEKEVHQALSKYRVKGEWFQTDKSFIINTILELADAREEQAMAEQKVS